MAIVNRTPDSFFDRGATYATDAAYDGDRPGGRGRRRPGRHRRREGRVRRTRQRGRGTAPDGRLRRGHPGPASRPGDQRRHLPQRRRPPRRRGRRGPASTTPGPAPIPSCAAAAAEVGAGLVCSHVGGLTPRTDPHRMAYDDVVADVIRTTTALAERAVAAGVRRDGILIDPTHDFGKNTLQSLELTRRLDELAATGWPVLVAVSNKDFIGETLELPPGQRGNGTLAALSVSAWLGARVFRVHDVPAARQALDLIAVLRGSASPPEPEGAWPDASLDRRRDQRRRDHRRRTRSRTGRSRTCAATSSPAWTARSRSTGSPRRCRARTTASCSA